MCINKAVNSLKTLDNNFVLPLLCQAISLTVMPQCSYFLALLAMVAAKYEEAKDKDEYEQLATVLLGVEEFHSNHTAENMLVVTRQLLEARAIMNKVKLPSTDSALNMISCAKTLMCSVHVILSLNL